MSDLRILPLTPDRWNDLEALFGERGAVGGCWCMWWRLSGKVYAANAGDNNRESFKQIVEENRVPGLLGYENDQPVGWVSLAPRSEYAARFNKRSPVFNPLDDLPVWSILCFFVHPEYREKHIARQLLQGAVAYAREQGVEWLEALPLDNSPPKKINRLYVGTIQMFEDAGFTKVGARHPERPFMRLHLKAE